MNDVVTDAEVTAELRGSPSRHKRHPRPKKLTDVPNSLSSPTAVTAGGTAGPDVAAGSAFHQLSEGGGGAWSIHGKEQVKANQK